MLFRSPVSYTHLDVYKRQPLQCSGLPLQIIDSKGAFKTKPLFVAVWAFRGRRGAASHRYSSAQSRRTRTRYSWRCPAARIEGLGTLHTHVPFKARPGDRSEVMNAACGHAENRPAGAALTLSLIHISGVVSALRDSGSDSAGRTLGIQKRCSLPTHLAVRAAPVSYTHLLHLKRTAFSIRRLAEERMSNDGLRPRFGT